MRKISATYKDGKDAIYNTHDGEVNIEEILKDVDEKIFQYGLEVVLKEYDCDDAEEDILGHPSFDFWIEKKLK